MGVKALYLPVRDDSLRTLRAGDKVLLNGVVFTGRDAAHKRFTQALSEGGRLPIDLRCQALYYVGPSPARPGQVIGACGPTSSYRMDAYTPTLLQEGLKVMLGKGRRSIEVRAEMQKYGAVYLATVGGTAALLAQCVVRAEAAAYEDLGAEMVYRLEVKDLPAVVINDLAGNDLYEQGCAAWEMH